MGSNSASTGGGGGGVGPAGIKKDGTYGTVKDAKKTSRRNELRTFIKDGGVVGTILKGVGEGISKKTKEMNLARRKKFISKSGLTSDDINMSDEYLSSKKGLAELKKQGYTTVSDTVNTGGGNDNNGNQVVQAPPVATIMPVEDLPQQVKAPESVMTSEEARAKANLLLKKRKGTRTKSSLIATSPQGITDDKGLTLGKKSLLG